MPDSPFKLDKDQTDRSTEMGWGAGRFPDPRFDYSAGSKVPIADPDTQAQLLALAAYKRTDLGNPADVPSPYVAGNTDNKPIKTRQFPSNWDLSTARALAVVKFFQAEGVDPRILGVAAYGQYHPIASNDPAEGRAKNRRIDIAMAPPPGELPTAK